MVEFNLLFKADLLTNLLANTIKFVYLTIINLTVKVATVTLSIEWSLSSP